MNKLITIDDICNVYDGPHATPKRTLSGPIYLGIKAISESGELIPSEFTYISEADYIKWTKRVTPIENDIVFSYEATLGRYAIIPKGFHGCLGRRLAVIRPKTDDVNIKWLYYYFQSPQWRAFINNNIIVGSTVDRISIDDFPGYPVLLPSKGEQDEIANVLSAIDRKIALNNRINAELEKVAKLLYDYWFVQFDFPNAKGKPYRQSGGEMVWDKQIKQEIPKGWQVRCLGDCVSQINTGLNPRRNFVLGRGSNRYITIKNIENGHIDFSKCDTVDDDALVRIHNRSDIQPGDILYTSIEPIGRLFLIAEKPIDWDINESVFSIRANKDVVSVGYLYSVLGSDSFRAKTFPFRTGSVQKGIRIGDLKAMPVVQPDDMTMARYTEIIEPILMKLSELEKENQELTALRDFLLPLLMNGQVTVAKAETVATPAVVNINDAEEKRRTVFKRLVLSAYILDNICDEPTAGRVKFEKLLYLSEHCAKIPLHSEFRRAAAGPYDSAALYGIEDQLKKNNWFKRQKFTGDSRAYIRLGKSSGYIPYLDTNFDNEQKNMIDKLLRLLKTQKTITCEIVATLYGAWNDFLLEGMQPTDDQIVDEVLTNWHESKERIDRDRWFKALDWMRQNDVVPTGYGMSTKDPVR